MIQFDLRIFFKWVGSTTNQVEFMGPPSCCHLKTLPTDKAINGPSSVRPAGRGPFVAGFGSAASGDISPNTHGSWCEAPRRVFMQKLRVELKGDPLRTHYGSMLWRICYMDLQVVDVYGKCACWVKKNFTLFLWGFVGDDMYCPVICGDYNKPL